MTTTFVNRGLLLSTAPSGHVLNRSQTQPALSHPVGFNGSVLGPAFVPTTLVTALRKHTYMNANKQIWC